MIALVITLLLSIFCVDYFAVNLAVIPRAFTLIPDVIAVIIGLMIFGRVLVLHRWELPKKYTWLVIFLILSCAIGLIAENVAPGVVVAGIRSYFKFLPLLFIAAVYRFTQKEINLLAGIFLFMAFIQVPLAFFQRFVQFAHRMHSGDPVSGTLSTSSSLTVILCLAIALVMTLYVQGKIKLAVALVATAFLASPTTINETKATLLLLPIATLGPFVMTFGEKEKWKRLVPVLGICVLSVIAFIMTYNAMKQFSWQGRGIDEFLMSGHFSWYLYRGAEVGADSSLGRVDSMILPFKVLSEQWMNMLFGVGIGNASPSFVAGLNGAYFEEFKPYGFGRTAIGNLLWEVGVVGLAIYMTMFIAFFRDARICARAESSLKWGGTWWSVAMLILILALAYKPILVFNETGYFLFLWAGIFGGQAWQLQHSGQTSEEVAVPRIKLAGNSREADGERIPQHEV